jgi:hypothetical protein
LNKLRHFAWTCMAALLVAGGLGCADHGPVDIFSRELFNKTIAPAQLDFAASAPITATAGAFNSYQSVDISLINDGASSTYGPLVVIFTCADPLMHLVPVAAGGPVMAFGANSTGKEVRASTAFIPLDGGYQYNGENIETLSSTSFQFYYGNGPGTLVPGTLYTPIIFINIKDAIGNTWNTQYPQYIQN